MSCLQLAEACLKSKTRYIYIYVKQNKQNKEILKQTNQTEYVSIEISLAPMSIIA